MKKNQIIILLCAFIFLGSVFFYFLGYRGKKKVVERQVEVKTQLMVEVRKDELVNQRMPTQGSGREGERKVHLVPSKNSKKYALSLRGLNIPLEKRKARGLFSLGKGKYALLPDVRALPMREGLQSDQFDKGDIYGEFAHHLVVNKEALTKKNEGRPVVINTRTKRMGIVSGLISLTLAHNMEDYFTLLEEAQRTFSHLNIQKRKNYDHLKLSLWRADSNFELTEIFKLEEWLGEKKLVKKAHVEVIESIKTGQ